MPRKIQQGSTWPPNRMLLTDGNGEPVDLSPADSIAYYARNGSDAPVTGTWTADSGQATPPTLPIPTGDGPWDPAEYHMTGRGWIEHALTETPNETNTPGTYKIWAGVMWDDDDDEIEWFPNDGNETLIIGAR